MFTGTYEHTIDSKNRVCIPAKYREQFLGKCFLTLGLDGCLYLYEDKEFENFLNDIRKLPTTKEGRTMKRYFLSNAVELEIDKQGRINIPSYLKDYANILKDVVFIGIGDKVEVWAKEQMDDLEYNMEDIAEKFSNMGIKF